MAKEVRLPQLGQTMEEGTIVGCMVKVSDEVEKGDKDINAIAHQRSALIEKAENNKLLLTDLEGGCITVSNLGAFR